MYWMEKSDPRDRPSRIVVTNRSTQRLEEMKSIHDRINPGIPMDYVHAPDSGDNDAVVNSLRPGSLVINATGRAKTLPDRRSPRMPAFPRTGTSGISITVAILYSSTKRGSRPNQGT